MGVRGESDLELSQDMAAGHAQRSLVLRGGGAVGVHLAMRLLDAGYIVYGVDVDDACRPEFTRAGGQVITCARRLPRTAAWRIECQELGAPAPEVLSRIAARPGYGRPRVELAGIHRPSDISSRTPVAKLTLRSGSRPGAGLWIDLHVSSRSPELSVRGDRSLFEHALSLLTTLSGRVTYDASASACPE